MLSAVISPSKLYFESSWPTSTNLTAGTSDDVTPMYSASLASRPPVTPDVDIKTYPLRVVEASSKAALAASESSPSSTNTKRHVLP